MTRIWIVRHGNTFERDEAPRRIGCRTDLPLTAEGRAQVVALAEWFRHEEIRFDTVLCSPLQRTRTTAALIADYRLALACDWLTEIDHGPDENLPAAAVLARIGEAALAAWDRDATPPPGWTVEREARIAAWRRLIRNARGDTLVVTSNGAARFVLLADAALQAQAATRSDIKMRTGSFGLIERDCGGRWTLGAWDRRI